VLVEMKGPFNILSKFNFMVRKKKGWYFFFNCINHDFFFAIRTFYQPMALFIIWQTSD
jgi:hypothetical protein